MGLRAVAESDLGIILENKEDFGWDVTLTSPSEVSTALVGLSNDINFAIDPDTGQAVSGRQASVAFRVSSLTELPEGISDATSKPWLVAFNDINGNPFTFKIVDTNPDRGLGIVTCLLELYQT